MFSKGKNKQYTKNKVLQSKEDMCTFHSVEEVKDFKKPLNFAENLGSIYGIKFCTP